MGTGRLGPSANLSDAMRTLLEQKLWTGNSRDARSYSKLYDVGVRAIVDLAAEELPEKIPREFIYCRFPLVDGAANDHPLLRLTVETTSRLIGAGVPTLVCCGAGMSRSLSIAALAVALTRGEAASEVLKAFCAIGAHDVKPAFWHEALAACEGALSTA